MGRISLELVPRDPATFKEELELVRGKFPCVDTINIPDILKYDVRIPEACELAAPFFPKVIPHVRAVSIHKDEPFPYVDRFRENNVGEVLIILGDNPEIVSKSDQPCDSVTLISKLKREMPDIKVYAGIDQWRTSFSEELEYVEKKRDAGADGFFTQPFFDLGLMEKYADKLRDTHVFWGLAPVIRESSKHYWETKNRIVFPEDFKCTMEWNRDFARQVLDVATDEKFHVYFCPITVDVVAYLTGIV
ncbi:MAG: methylenetetrahydrofolate reductase [Candidatus Omnitrophica bacterium]|nr:methylenetetrahydrofolate reductase [Candidatus Omnitrophota bacterium]MDD5488643.1 methylenetetrahydrofolate reductase [Candidatus Omnitrophota bacterium]